MVARKIPDDLQDMELTEILPMHLQRFVNAFAVTASKSYMDKLHVLLGAVFAPVRKESRAACLVSPHPGAAS